MKLYCFPGVVFCLSRGTKCKGVSGHRLGPRPYGLSAVRDSHNFVLCQQAVAVDLGAT